MIPDSDKLLLDNGTFANQKLVNQPCFFHSTVHYAKNSGLGYPKDNYIRKQGEENM